MKNIGIIRNMDALGRITIPKGFRQVFHMEKNKPIEILATDDGVLLRNPTVEVKWLEEKATD